MDRKNEKIQECEKGRKENKIKLLAINQNKTKTSCWMHSILMIGLQSNQTKPNHSNKGTSRHITSHTWMVLLHQLTKGRLDVVLVGSSVHAQDDVVIVELLLELVPLLLSITAQVSLAPEGGMRKRPQHYQRGRRLDEYRHTKDHRGEHH